MARETDPREPVRRLVTGWTMLAAAVLIVTAGGLFPSPSALVVLVSAFLAGAYIAFGGLVAISDMSFHVNEGELVSLIGPNGAGKTTAFNVVTGFLRPTKGVHLVFPRERVGNEGAIIFPSPVDGRASDAHRTPRPIPASAVRFSGVSRSSGSTYASPSFL